jgi:uncharacterized protein YbjQ (UPF0145 family)
MVCNYCKKEIIEKSGLFGTSNRARSISENTFTIINRYFEIENLGFCESCVSGMINKAYFQCEREFIQFEKTFDEVEKMIPILTIQKIDAWQYDVISIVTAQGVMGTGFLTEWKSSWGDLLGTESSSLNAKFNEGEQICFSRMRKKCMALNGNAIIGVDIDYAEVGGVKAMTMVCTAGTAIKVNNLEIFETAYRQALIENENAKLKYLQVKEDAKYLNKLITL